MRALTASVALALPDESERGETARAVEEARRERREVEVRIGVGPLERGVPARVLGHAACLAEALRVDVVTVARRPDRIVIFSSAPKAGNTDTSIAIQSLCALAGALRLAGVDVPIVLDLADATGEIPKDLKIRFSASLTTWLQRAAERSGNRADPRTYAIEHAAPSMFADLAEAKQVPLRITLGSAPEARFWAARMRVREAAIASGLAVAPAVGVIMKGLRVPWYSPTPIEPALLGIALDPARAVADLDACGNPSVPHGNYGLKREARATQRFVDHAGLGAFIDGVADVRGAYESLRAAGFGIGQRLAKEAARFT